MSIAFELYSYQRQLYRGKGKVKMIDIFLLEQLDAFARKGTLQQAAAELHLSQPALTRSMKKLENLLGVSLFERGNSKIALNETGKVAAEYAKRVLDADREMVEQTLAFDRRRRTIVIGSCAPFPIQELLPVLQNHFTGMAITAEITNDARLTEGLRNGLYQLAILHTIPDDKTFVCQRCLDEQLYITVPREHPLAAKKEVLFQDLEGISILTSGNTGFWLDLCREKLKENNLLIQNFPDVMTELVDASTLPVFNSDRMLERGYAVPGRVSIPIADAEARATYYIACPVTERKRYAPIFNAVRSMLIRER